MPELPTLSVTIDGTHVEAPDPTWNHEIGGHGQASVEIAEEDARKLNIQALTSELKIFAGTDEPRFHGRVAAVPRPTPDGTMEITAVGFKDLAEKAAGRRLYVSYGLGLWTEMDGGEHAYSVQDKKVSADIRKSTIRHFIQNGTSIAVSDVNGSVCWVPGDTITSIAGTLSGDVDANNNVRIRSATGPAGALVTEHEITATGNFNKTITAGQDLVALMYRRAAGAAVVASNVRQVVSALRVRGRSSGDSMTAQAVLQDVGSALGYNTSGVSSSLSTNIMPLDWDSGSWSSLMDYVCMLEDAWWRVGTDSYLEADKWANSRVWTVNQETALVNLAPQEAYVGIVVKYVNASGRPRQKTAGTVTAGSNVYEVSLADPQNDGTFAQAIATALLNRVTAEAWAGDIDMVSALNENGLDDIYGLLPGDKIQVTDWDMGESKTHRVFGVSCSQLGVTAHIEPAGLPDESMLAMQGLRRARNQRRVFVGNNPDKEFRGKKGKRFVRYMEGNWKGKYEDMGWREAQRLYNEFQRSQGRDPIGRKKYRRRFF